MDEAIREKYPPEIAERLVGREHGERVEDEPLLWNDPDEIGAIDPGFFMYASEIDWSNDRLRAEWIPGDSSKPEFLFPRED